MMTQKSFWLTKEAGEAQREWYVVDATGQTLGRLASQDRDGPSRQAQGDLHAERRHGRLRDRAQRRRVQLTGTKPDKKLYRHHTLFPGGIKTRLAKDVLADDPERAIREAVWGMMPKGPLGRRIIKKLKIYKGGEHEHTAQKPRVLEIKN